MEAPFRTTSRTAVGILTAPPSTTHPASTRSGATLGTTTTVVRLPTGGTSTDSAAQSVLQARSLASGRGSGHACRAGATG